MSPDLFAPAVVFLVLLLLACLAGKGLICWVLKINRRIELMEEIRDLLKQGEQKE